MLELGGKSANIVFDDANLDQAEAGVLAGIFAAAGQTCVAGSRAYIHASIYDAFVDRIVRRAQQITIGDPLKAATQMGPVATKMQLEKDESMVQRAVARRRRGAVRRARAGARTSFLTAISISRRIVHQLTKDNFLMRNEVFGPVLAVHAVQGRSRSARARQRHRVRPRRRRLDARHQPRAQDGARAWSRARSGSTPTARLTFNSPFGGYKASGIGRQNGIEAVYQYLQTKSVWCELGDEVQDPFIMKV